MANYDAVDIDWSWDGDHLVGPDGDIADTSDDYSRSLVNEITTVIKSELLEWEKDPTIGADLSDFVGEPNTRENGARLEDRVRTRLVDSGIVVPEDLTVRVIPLSIHRVMISITVLALATVNNDLTVGEPIVVNLVFDTTENGTFVLPISELRKEQL